MRRFARLVTRLIAITGFLGFFGAIIAGLVMLVGWPLPHRWPSTHQWLAWATNTQPLITTRFLIDVGACLMWAFLGWLLVVIVLDTARRLRRPHLRIPVRRQGFLGGLVSAFLLGTSQAAAAHTGTDALTPTHHAAAAADPGATIDKTTEQVTHTGQHTYTVQPGDTLWDIAAAQTGDPQRYHQIAAHNQRRAEPDGRRFTDPDLIYPGWTLAIPTTADHTPTTAPHQHPPAHRPSPHAHATPSTATPSPPATTGPADTPSTAPDSRHAAQRVHSSGRPITLPGGSLIGIPLAGALSAALAAVAVIRWRRRYRPHPPGTDPASAAPPMPPLVDQLNTALQEAAGQNSEDTDQATRPEASGETDQNLPDSSYAEDGPAVVDSDRPLSLSGPDAPDAARGLLIAAVTHHHRLVVTRAFTDRVLHGAEPARLPGIQVADTLEAALTALDLHLIETATTTDRPDESPTDTSPDGPPALVLFATDIPDDHRPRLDALITQPLLGAVLLPTSAEADAIPVDHADPTAPGRQLDLIHLNDALAILHALRPEPPAPRTATAAEPGDAGQPDIAPGHQAPPPTGPARVRLLGTPTILMPNGAPAEGLRERAAAFLTYLAIHRRTGADADELLEATGLGTIRRSSANQRLYTDISNLRTILAAAAGDTSDSPRRYIVRSHGRYHIDPARVEVDLWQLHDAINQAAGATDTDQRLTALQAAVNTYTGELAHGIDHLWTVEARETALTEALNAATALADHHTPTNPHRALDLLTTAIDWSPYAEDLYQRAMRLHAALDDPAGIRMLFTSLAAHLRDLDTTPGPDTRDLATSLIDHHRRPHSDNTTSTAAEPEHTDPTPTG